jgi:hypothetical protein
MVRFNINHYKNELKIFPKKIKGSHERRRGILYVVLFLILTKCHGYWLIVGMSDFSKTYYISSK